MDRRSAKSHAVVMIAEPVQETAVVESGMGGFFLKKQNSLCPAFVAFPASCASFSSFSFRPDVLVH